MSPEILLGIMIIIFIAIYWIAGKGLRMFLTMAFIFGIAVYFKMHGAEIYNAINVIN